MKLPHNKALQLEYQKKAQLRSERGICFEEVLFHIENGNVWDILEHPNQSRYKCQRIFIIAVAEYIYLVPFVEDDKEVFLNTIIPSCKAARRYLGKYDE